MDALPAELVASRLDVVADEVQLVMFLVRGRMNGEPGGGHHLPLARSGSANAMYVPPLGASFFPPPHAITTYCRPFTMYVDGVAFPAAGSVASHSSFPVRLS